MVGSVGGAAPAPCGTAGPQDGVNRINSSYETIASSTISKTDYNIIKSFVYLLEVKNRGNKSIYNAIYMLDTIKLN